jgi:hypothetical protein
MAIQALVGIVAQSFIMGVCAAGQTEWEGRVGIVGGNLIKRVCTIAWALTASCAPGLSKRCIWDALKNRRVYSTLDRNRHMMFFVNGAVMGSIVEEPVREVEVSLTVSHADPGDRIAKIELFEDGEVVETDEPNAQGRCWKTARTPDTGQHYYFLKVPQADGNLLWSAPVWAGAQRLSASEGESPNSSFQ